MKAWTALVAVGALTFGGCSSDDEPQELGFELRSETDFDSPVGTFEASGAAVDEGLMCAAGETAWQRSETLDGEEFTDEDLGVMWDAGEPFEFVVVNEYLCDDGSLVLAEQLSLDPANPDRPGDVIGTWSVRSGEIDSATITCDV